MTSDAAYLTTRITILPSTGLACALSSPWGFGPGRVRSASLVAARHAGLCGACLTALQQLMYASKEVNRALTYSFVSYGVVGQLRYHSCTTLEAVSHQVPDTERSACAVEN